MYNRIKSFYLISIVLIIFSKSYIYAGVSKTQTEIKAIEYCEISFSSDINHFYETKTVQKGTVLQLKNFPKLSNSKYKLVGWELEDKVINKSIVVSNNMSFSAVWEEKAIQPSDWIQISVVIVALLAIFLPRFFQKRDEKRIRKDEEEKKPKLRLHCDEKDEGIFTKCRLTNHNEAISFKIRVFNEGYTTAKNVQIKIKGFDVSNPPNITEFNYSFMKLNWSYQDQQRRLNLPLETKIDIQPKSYEDCDFVFFDKKEQFGYFASEQSNLLLHSNGSYRVTVIVSGDNILSDEYTICFSYDKDNTNNPIEVKIDFRDELKCKNGDEK